jgi:hypothetical protein
VLYPLSYGRNSSAKPLVYQSLSAGIWIGVARRRMVVPHVRCEAPLPLSHPRPQPGARCIRQGQRSDSLRRSGCVR